VLRHSPGTAADLYAALMAVDKDAVAARAALWQGRPAEPMRLPELMRRFYEDRFLSDYARPEGLAAAMARVGRRAAVQNFSAPSDQDLLAALFVEFEAEAEAFRAALYEDAPGFIAPARAWYNTGDIPT